MEFNYDNKTSLHSSSEGPEMGFFSINSDLQFVLPIIIAGKRKFKRHESCFAVVRGGKCGQAILPLSIGLGRFQPRPDRVEFSKGFITP